MKKDKKNTSDLINLILIKKIGKIKLNLNFKDKKITFGDYAINSNQIKTTLFIESNYLQAILDRKSHWNNAIISLNLDWEREPNIFDRGWYDSLNFFHTYPD